MRHKYDTFGLVLGRVPSGEANALVSILTPEFGLVRARAQGLRRPGAKLAPALATFAESELVLVRGREGWRVTGALLRRDWFSVLSRPARERAGRVAALLMRLAAGESNDHMLYPALSGLLEALADKTESAQDALEILGALSVLGALGLDGDARRTEACYSNKSVARVQDARVQYVARINRGIAASGL